MTKQTNKKALILSLLSLLLCCSMLVGTTFAWFTDSVTSGNNRIVAGNLDIELVDGKGNTVEGSTALFRDVNGNAILWEPGVVTWENLTVKNVGTLALKYKLAANFYNENFVTVDGEMFGLSDILQIAVIKGGVKGTTRETVKAEAEGATDRGSLTEFAYESMLLPVGQTIPNAPQDAAVGEETYGIVIWWEPSAEDNIWNVNNGKVVSDYDDSNPESKNELHIDLGILLEATQLVAEDDSFDNKYDEDAKTPDGVVVYPGENEEKKLTDGIITVIVPAGSPAGKYKLSGPNGEVKGDRIQNGDKVLLDTDFCVLRDGVPTTDVTYTVQLKADVMSTVSNVKHNGTDIQFSYDPFYDVITFTTNTFSPFTAEYTIFGEAVDFNAEKREIYSGLFTEVDPATLGENLKEDTYKDSGRLVVDFEKGGKTVYSVSEKATTVVVGNDTTSYECTYGDTVSVTPENGELWKTISGLQSNDHSTVYLLPGTYNEATTIYVYSSMNIIGLGDTEDIKVVKTSSSNSNRHLFNANGTKADYIEVTIRNMTLDATAKTTGGKDNAAVQSIRKSKVKCYDLSIIKGTGWDAVAFYVNGNNAVDGVKYTAYLYVEDCSLNTTRTFGIVSTAGSYKFYHDGLTYNNGTAYTKNSGSIQNTAMDWDDWWD